MRRLNLGFTNLVAIILIGLLLTICSLAGMLPHDNSTSTNSPTKGCATSCHTHGQASVLTELGNKELEDDKEPKPPFGVFSKTSPVLIIFYILPVSLLAVLTKQRKKFLLSTQLLF